MRVIISLRLRPRDIIPRIRTPNSDFLSDKTVWDILFLNQHKLKQEFVTGLQTFTAIEMFYIRHTIVIFQKIEVYIWVSVL
jgi:hypothetical protein